MTKFNIELPETFDIASRGKSVTADLTKFSPEIIANLALHGLRQKVADAAASATKAAEGTDMDAASMGKIMMQKVVDALTAGEWTQRVAGDGASAETRMRRTVLGEMIRKTEAGKAAWKANEENRDQFLDKVFDKQSEAKQAAIMELVAERIAEAQRKADQAKELAQGIAL